MMHGLLMIITDPFTALYPLLYLGTERTHIAQIFLVFFLASVNLFTYSIRKIFATAP